MRDVLFLSNGHGEDTIAVRILRELATLRPDLTPDAWPMVGDGAAYRDTQARLVGVPNLLPSAGFATLAPQLMMRDLKAGWIGTHWRQYRAAREMRGQYRLLVQVGDIIPLLAGAAIGAKRVFVGCAKSAYYQSAAYRYNAAERRLMRGCDRVFPRDEKTARELWSAGIATTSLGNPMMDGLDAGELALGALEDDTLVAVLPGSRADAPDNIVDLLKLLEPVGVVAPETDKLVFAFAVTQGTSLDRVLDGIAGTGWTSRETPDSVPGLQLALEGPGGMRALFLRDRFADILHRATLAIGMSGTGNEQAVGLGLPLIAVPSRGVQGPRFVAMKAEYFGSSSVSVAAQGRALADALGALLADPQRRSLMAAAGRERMGAPGASAAIAREIAGMLPA